MRQDRASPSTLSLSNELVTLPLPLPRAKSAGRRRIEHREKDSSLSVVELERERRSLGRSTGALGGHDSGSRSEISRNRDTLSSRRHSAEVSTSKSVYSSTYDRRASAPDTLRNTKSLLRTQPLIDDRSRSSKSTTRVMTSRSVASTTSNKEAHQRPYKSIERGRSKSRPKNAKEPHNSPSLRSAASDIQSIFSRGRSKSNSRAIGEHNSVTSAAHSFTKNLRRRSLSRGASKVLATTSEMDGNRDAEPGTQIYDVPFNPATGRCLYHSEIVLAVKNGVGRDGWKIVSLGCPKCEMRR